MPMNDYLFTSESVTEGHPDKMADQISDAVLDAILAQHPRARVACETLTTTGLVVVAGEITTSAVITGVSAAAKRIGLSLKQALGDPWDDITARMPVGATVEGPIVSLAEFGAFMELAEGIEGMIHIGDISREKRLKHPKEVLTVGQRVRAQVLEMDRSKRRIRLGMKQLEPTSIDEYIAEHKAGDKVSGRLVDLSQKRAFLCYESERLLSKGSKYCPVLELI